MAQKKTTYLEKMGLYPVSRLSKALCRERVAFLRKGIKAKRFEGKLLAKAKYYANWYAWMAENGGHRGSKKAS